MVRLVAQLPPRLQIGVVTRRQQVRGISTLSEYIIPKTKRPSIKPLPLPAELNEPGVSTLACNLDKPSRVRSSHLEISPASFGWFKTKGVDKSVLRTDLFKEHGTHSLVPLEYLGVDPSNDTFTFKRFNAPLATFASFVEAPSKNFNLYLAQCDFTSFPEKLRAYLHENPRFLRKYSSKKHLYGRNIWIGLPPTYTPLHRDPNHNYFQQIAGSKTVRLMSPEMGLKVYSKVVGGDVAYDLASGADPRGIIRSEEMMVSPQREELYRAVWENQDPDIEIFEGKIEKNQSLFIPAGWWHSFKSGGTRNAKGWNTTAISGSINFWFQFDRQQVWAVRDLAARRHNSIQLMRRFTGNQGSSFAAHLSKVFEIERDSGVECGSLLGDCWPEVEKVNADLIHTRRRWGYYDNPMNDLKRHAGARI